MALWPFFKRKNPEAETGAAPAPMKSGRRGAPAGGAARTPSGAADLQESPAIAQARTRARRRLMGAAVLLLLGVLLFPLIFETKPRPLPMDLPITVAPGKSAPVAAAPVQPVTPVTPVTPARPAPPMITETAEPEPAREAPAPGSAPPSAASAAAPAVATAAPAAPAPPPGPAPASAPSTARFVVQVGAFADDVAVRQTRQKVENLGLKTYTQEVNTEAGKRVRVRVGPFASKEEASQVLYKLKGAGLPGAVLAL